MVESQQVGTHKCGSRERGKKSYTCAVCSATFKGYRYHKNKRYFCSKGCFSLRISINPRNVHSCAQCEKVFIRKKRSTISRNHHLPYCSLDCYRSKKSELRIKLLGPKLSYGRTSLACSFCSKVFYRRDASIKRLLRGHRPFCTVACYRACQRNRSINNLTDTFCMNTRERGSHERGSEQESSSCLQAGSLQVGAQQVGIPQVGVKEVAESLYGSPKLDEEYGEDFLIAYRAYKVSGNHTSVSHTSVSHTSGQPATSEVG